MAKDTEGPSMSDFIENEDFLGSFDDGEDNKDGDEFNPDDLDDAGIQALKDQDPEELSDEQKAYLETLSDEDTEAQTKEKADVKTKPKKDEEVFDGSKLSDEDIEVLRNKEEEDLSNEEIAFLNKLDAEAGEVEDPNEPEEGSFWDDVEALTGNKVTVDYGDTDPDSPEGAVMREEAVSRQAVDDFLEAIETEKPKLFKAIQHSFAGGSLEDLYKAGEKDYSKIEVKEGDEDHAKSILEDYYANFKNMSPARAKRMVEADIDSEEGAVANATEVLKEMTTAQESRREKIAAEQKAQEDARRLRDNEILTGIDNIVNTGQLETFVVPKREQKDFSNFVKGSIKRNGEGYDLVTPLDPSNLEKQLKVEYLKFKKGDISKLAVTKETTKKTRRLKRVVKKKENTMSGGAPAPKKTGDRSQADFIQD